MKPRVFFSRLSAFVIFAILTLAPNARGQVTSSGTLLGTVTDPSGAGVPGATVRLTNSATGLHSATTTVATGEYAFRSVAPGTYRVEVQATGFRAAVRPLVVVETAGVAEVDFKLAVGQASQTVTVNAREQITNTTTPTISQMITYEHVQNLPLSEKSIAVLTRLQAGSTPVQINTYETSSNTDTGGFLDGQRQFFESVTLDGAYFSDPMWPGGTMTTTEGSAIDFDAVREFRVVKASGGANEQMSGGAAIVLTSRSGGTNYHGSLFEFLRNNALDARNFFDGSKIPPFHRNQFGGSFGGPIVPGRQGNYFFGSTEIFRQSEIVPFETISPTPLLLSELPSGAANGYLREIFSAAYPQPILGTYAPTALVAPAPGITNLGRDYENFLVRTDHRLTKNDQLTFRYNYSNGTGQPGVTFAEGTAGGDAGFYWLIQNGLVRWTHTLSPDMVNQVHFAYNRVAFTFLAAPTPPSLVALGFNPSANSPEGLPFLDALGTGLSFVGPLAFVPRHRFEDSFEGVDNLSWNEGRHLLTFGFQVLRNQDNSVIGYNTRPSTFFLGFGPPFDNSAFGLTTGTFLVQTQNFFLNPAAEEQGFRQTVFNSYAQDQFKAAPSLTLTYGLRWGFTTPIATAAGLVSNGYVAGPNGQPQCGADLGISNINGLALGPVGTSGGCDIFNFPWKNFAPNLGIAWKTPWAGLVVRSGYSLSYAVPYFDLTESMRFNPPYGSSTVLVGQTFGTIANPLTSTTPPNLFLYDPGAKTPYVQYWNVSVERAFGSNLLVRVAYVGDKATHLPYISQPNLGSSFVGTRPNPNFSLISQERNDVNSNYNSLQIEVTRRFAHGFSLQGTYTYAKSLDQNSTSINDFSADIGGTVTNQFDRNLDYGPSDFNIPQSGVINYIYDLPFGPGRSYLKSTAGPLGKLIEGWQISGITTFSDNIPIGLLSGLDNNGDGVVNDRAYLLPGGNMANVTHQVSETQFLNPASVGKDISATTAGVQIGRNTLYGPHIVEFDFEVRKTTSINEQVNLEFTSEMFNIFNHPIFADPNATVSSPAFGAITSTVLPSRQIQFGLRLNF